MALLAGVIPAVGVIALMGWALARSGGTPGGLGIYKVFGEVAIEPGPAPPFSLELLTGEAVKLEDLRGKVVLVDFWSSWCPPCVEEAPTLAQVYREYSGRGVEFLGIAIWDDEDVVRRHVARFRVPYLNAIDGQGTVAIDYGVRGIPEKFFLDREGKLVKKFVGPAPAEKLRAILDELLGGLGTARAEGGLSPAAATPGQPGR